MAFVRKFPVQLASDGKRYIVKAHVCFCGDVSTAVFSFHALNFKGFNGLSLPLQVEHTMLLLELNDGNVTDELLDRSGRPLASTHAKSIKSEQGPKVQLLSDQLIRACFSSANSQKNILNLPFECRIRNEDNNKSENRIRSSENLDPRHRLQNGDPKYLIIHNQLF